MNHFTLLLRASGLLFAWLLLAGHSRADTPDDLSANLQLHLPIGDVTPYYLRNRPLFVAKSNQGYQRPSNDAALNFNDGATTEMSGFFWSRVTAWNKYPWFLTKGNYDSTGSEGTWSIGTGADGSRIDWLINTGSTTRLQISFNTPLNRQVKFVDASEFCLGFTFDGKGVFDDGKMKMWASSINQTEMTSLVCTTSSQSTPGLPTLWRSGTGVFRVATQLETPYPGLDGSVSNLLLVDGVTWSATEMELLRNHGMPLWIGPATVAGGIVTTNVNLIDLASWDKAGVKLTDGATYLLTAQTPKQYQNGYWTYNRTAPIGQKFSRPKWFSNWHRVKSALGHGANNGKNYDFYAINGPPIGTLNVSPLSTDGDALTCTKINQTTGPTSYSAWAFDEASGDAIDYGSNKLNLPRLTGTQAPATDLGVLGLAEESPLALKFYAGAPRRQNGSNVAGDRCAAIAYEPRWLPDGGGAGVGGLTGNPGDTASFVCAQDAWCDFEHMSAHITFKLLTDLPGETFFLFAADDASQHVFTGTENATDPTHNPANLGPGRIGQVDNQWILWGLNATAQTGQAKHNNATTWRHDCSDVYGPLSGTGMPYFNGDRLNAYGDIIPATKANGFVTTLVDNLTSGLYPGNTSIVTGNSYVCTWATVNDDKGNTTTPGTHRHWINGVSQRVYINAGGGTPKGIERGALTNLPTRNVVGIAVPAAALVRGISVFGDLTESQVIAVDEDLVPLKDE